MIRAAGKTQSVVQGFSTSWTRPRDSLKPLLSLKAGHRPFGPRSWDPFCVGFPKRQLARVGQSLSPIFCAGECLFVIRFSFEGFPNFFPLLFFKGITMGFILFVEEFERKKDTRFKELPIYVYMYIFKSSISFVIFHCNYSKKNRKNSPKESSSSNYLTRPISKLYKTAENSKIRIFISLFFRPIILASTRRSKRLVEGQSVRHRHRYPPRRWRSVSVLTIVAS